MKKALLVVCLSKKQPTTIYLHSPVGTCFADFSKSILSLAFH